MRTISPAEMGDWLKLLAAEPNHVGSPHDKANAEWILAQFKSWGWDAHIETFDVLYPTPIHESLEILTAPKPFKATLQETPIPGDTSATAKDYALPAYFAYQGDGDVTAPARLCQLRHEGRLRCAARDWASASKARSSSRATAWLARPEAEAGAGARRRRLHHLFRSARRRLCDRQRPIPKVRRARRKASSAAPCRT